MTTTKTESQTKKASPRDPSPTALLRMPSTIGGLKWFCGACGKVFQITTDDNSTPQFCPICGNAA